MDSIHETFAPAAKSVKEPMDPSPLALLLQTLRQQLPATVTLTVAVLKQVLP